MPITALKPDAMVHEPGSLVVPEGGMPITALKRGDTRMPHEVLLNVPEGGMPITALKRRSLVWRRGRSLSQRGACRSRH